MPKTKRAPQLVTRLATADLEKFRELAFTRRITYSHLLREAVLNYLATHDQVRVNELEGIYAQQLKQQINRLCSLLVKIGIDVHSVYQYLAKVDDENSSQLMSECTAHAARRLKTSLNADEQPVALGMAQVIQQAN